MVTMNYFASRSAAARYAQGRPYFHAQVVRRIKDRLALAAPVPQAIDVGCGTGLSTVTLTEIATRVVGVDSAAAMVTLAPSDARITYLVAPAERLPVEDGCFDLMTVSSALHWIDADPFFAEARRVLRPGAPLVVYDNSFTGRMRGNAAFERWQRDVYLVTYPSPPRAHVAFDEETCAQRGFRLLDHERYHNIVAFSPATLVDYLTTQSNVIAAVEDGRQGIDDARRWLLSSVEQFFGGRREAHFDFGGPIWYLAKM